MTTQTLAPPHQRLEGFSLRHLAATLKELWTMSGTKGWDIFRDSRTQTKEAMIAHIRATYTPEQIDTAHRAVQSTYPAGNGFRGRNRQRVPLNVGQPAPAQTVQQPASGEPGVTNGSQQQTPAAPAPAPAPAPAQAPNTGNIPLPGPQSSSDPMAALAQALWPHLRPGVGSVATALDMYVQQQVTEQLQKGIEEATKALKAKGVGAGSFAPTVVALTTPTMPEPKNLGQQHKNFPLLLKACHARLRSGHRLNVWLYGPAGTGKTTAAEKVSEALGLDFHYSGALDTKYEVVGFVNAGGGYVSTALRNAWEHGGVYLLDEIDASMPGALLALNGALANGRFPFPDGKLVPRHADCVIIAAANTTGMGATVEYVGRMKQDATLTDRFVFLDWPLDEALEASLCADAAWLARVRQLRGNVKTRNIRGMQVTPRAAIFGEALIAAGIERATVEAMTVRKGADQETWDRVR